VAEIESATAGTTGHEKARRQRVRFSAIKNHALKPQKITKALEGASGEYADALRWVLGELYEP
jgi:ParB family chromosome partitioning protein